MLNAVILGICAVASAIIALTAESATLLGCITWPLIALGRGLRTLSLSGTFGNILAFAIYIFLSLTPLSAFFLKRKRSAWDICWVLTSACAFCVIYLLINPALLAVNPSLKQTNGIAESMAALVLMSFIAVSFIIHFADSGMRDSGILRSISILLTVFECMQIVTAFGVNLAGFMSSISGSGKEGWDIFAAVLRFAYALVTSAFMLMTLERARSMAKAMEENWYTAKSAERAGALAAISRTALKVNVAGMALVNAVMLLIAGKLSNASVNMTIPVTEITICVIALAAAKSVSAGFEMKRENDAFI